MRYHRSLVPITALAAALLVACSSPGPTGGGFLPAGSAGGTPEAGHTTRLVMSMTIPGRHRRGAAIDRHPSTISPLTESVTIAVNRRAPKAFNVTPSSPGCTAGAAGTTCRFSVAAPIGTDSIVVSTFSWTGGGGTMLDRGTATLKVVPGRANVASVKLGPVVTTTADSGEGSLRYAIATANAGDTIMFFLPAHSTIVVGKPIALSNDVTIAGPGVRSGVTIDGGGATQMFLVQPTAVATISGLVLAHGHANVIFQPGGAIFNAGTLTLAADLLQNNSSIVQSPLLVSRPSGEPHGKIHPHRMHPHCSNTYEDGGAVFNEGALTVSGSSFSANAVSSIPSSCIYSRGGAIFNAKTGVLSVANSSFSANAAYNGGAVYNDSAYAQASFVSDTFTGNLGCTAATGCPYGGGYYAEGYGTAIDDEAGPGVIITNSTFDGNVAGGNSPESYGEGGAIVFGAGNPVVTGTTFRNNVAGGGTTGCSSGEGAAIQNNAQVLELDNDTFVGNVSGGDSSADGGAIYTNGLTRGANDTFTSNVAQSTGCAPSISYGGAIEVAPAGGGLDLTNSTFTGNTATSAYIAYGGAIYDDSSARLSNVKFTSNAASGTGGGGSASASAYGGAIYSAAATTLTTSGCSFTTNSATVSGAVASEASGGAVDAQNTYSSSADKFTSNAARATGGSTPAVYGGAIAALGVTTLTHDIVSNNSASSVHSAYGGGLYGSANGSAVTSTTFNANSATGTAIGEGGGIYNNFPMTLQASILSGNVASMAGGGMYENGGGDVISNVTISGNTVTASQSYGGGGGIYIWSSTTLVNATIAGNVVTVSGPYSGGGGIYNDSGLSMTGSAISGNVVKGSAANSGGGGMYSYDDAVVTNSTFASNSSGAGGGGVEAYPTGYTQRYTNVTFVKNSATGTGGNIDNPASNAVVLANSIVGGGSASSGADVANAGTLTSNNYNVTQSAVPFNGGNITNNVFGNPKLSALSNNGGPTWTAADNPGSPGLAKIPFTINNGSVNATCGTYDSNVGLIAVDQRGYARGSGGFCDAGAYEYSGVASAARIHLPHVRGNHHPHASRLRKSS
jgi:hypothetical protein